MYEGFENQNSNVVYNPRRSLGDNVGTELRRLATSSSSQNRLPQLAKDELTSTPKSNQSTKPKAQSIRSGKPQAIADPLTMFKADIKPFELLSSEEEHELGAAIGEGKSAVIEALGKIPLCSRILAERYELACTERSHLIDVIENLADTEPAPPPLHPSDELVFRVVATVDTNTVDEGEEDSAAAVQATQEIIRCRIKRLRNQFQRAQQNAVNTEAGQIERSKLASEFSRLELAPTMIFRLIKHVGVVGQRLAQQTSALSEADHRRMETALRKLGKVCPEKRHGGFSVRSQPDPSASTLPLRSASSRIEHEAGLVVEQFVEVLEQLANAAERYAESRDTFLRGNFRLVLHVARQFAVTSVDFADLVQEGNIGLLKAVEKFDCRFGCRFSTYASFWIRLSISRAMNRQQRVIPLPYAQMARLSMIARTNQEIAQHSGNEPSIATVANQLKMNEQVLRDTLIAGQGILSFDQGEQDEADAPSLYNTLEQSTFPAPLEVISEQSLRTVLSEAIDTLDAKEAHIVGAHFGITQTNEQTLQELGKQLGLTRERVRQIKVKALDRLRKRYGDMLHPFLEQR